MLVTLLLKFRNKDCKTTELELLLQVLPVRIVTFVETLGSHLNFNFNEFYIAQTSMWHFRMRITIHLNGLVILVISEPGTG